MIVNQGEVYWINNAEAAAMSASSIPHPYVVIQDDLLNHSRLDIVVVCALTSNLNRASYPGNVLLEDGEANLPRRSVIEVAKVSAVKKTDLGELIGSLSAERVNQILAGLRFLQSSYYSGR